MSKVLSICFVIVGLLIFSSCEKERGAAEACFTTGNSELKSGSIIRFINCSKNFDAVQWYVTNGADITDTLYKDQVLIPDTIKNLAFSFPVVGSFNVTLNVRQREDVSQSTITKNINITAP